MVQLSEEWKFIRNFFLTNLEYSKKHQPTKKEDMELKSMDGELTQQPAKIIGYAKILGERYGDKEDTLNYYKPNFGQYTELDELAKLLVNLSQRNLIQLILNIQPIQFLSSYSYLKYEYF